MAFDELAQVGDIVQLTFGLGVFAQDAFVDVGSTAMPDPGTDPGYPWLWWGSYFLESFVAAGPESLGPAFHRVAVDARAMRKITQNKTLGWVVQSEGQLGSPVTNIAVGDTRILVAT